MYVQNVPPRLEWGHWRGSHAFTPSKKTPNRGSEEFRTKKVPKRFQMPNYFTPFPKKIQILEHFQNFRKKSETFRGSSSRPVPQFQGRVDFLPKCHRDFAEADLNGLQAESETWTGLQTLRDAVARRDDRHYIKSSQEQLEYAHKRLRNLRKPWVWLKCLKNSLITRWSNRAGGAASRQRRLARSVLVFGRQCSSMIWPCGERSTRRNLPEPWPGIFCLNQCRSKLVWN